MKINKQKISGGTGNNGSSSGSPSHFLPPGHSPTPSSTPVSELSPGNYKFFHIMFSIANKI